MSISSITSGLPQGWQSVFQQRRQDFSQLAQALQSGDLAGAQKAYANLQSLQPGGQSGSSLSSNSTANPIQNDFSALGQALASGNLSQAQNAFSQLQIDFKTAAQQSGAPTAGHVHDGHHHHHSAASEQDATSNAGDTSTPSSGNSNSSGSVSVIA